MSNQINVLKDAFLQLGFDDDKAGAALVLFKDSECVLECAFGQANASDLWTPHTLSVNYSIGKGVLATLVAVLVSKGLLDYEVPIAHVWSDFAQNGKADITLMQVLSHRANLFRIKDVASHNDELADWQTMLDKIAAMTPTAPQGVYDSAYSALISGWVLGGLIERATQMPFQTALERYLAQPLGVAGELFFGLPQSYHDTIALPQPLWYDRFERKKPVLKPDSQQTQVFFEQLPIGGLWESEYNTQAINRLYFDHSQINLFNHKDALFIDRKTAINYHDPKLLATPIPAANGVSSAFALARMYAMHANEGVWEGDTLIDPTVLAKMRQINTTGMDGVMPATMHWRAGFHRLFSLQNTPNAYGHMGYNGSVAFCDPDRALALAFIHNFDTTMLNDVRQFVLTELALVV